MKYVNINTKYTVTYSKYYLHLQYHIYTESLKIFYTHNDSSSNVFDQTFLQRYLKDNIYTFEPAAIAKLRAATEWGCTQNHIKFNDVFDSIALHCQNCLDQNRHPFENKH